VRCCTEVKRWQCCCCCCYRVVCGSCCQLFACYHAINRKQSQKTLTARCSGCVIWYRKWDGTVKTLHAISWTFLTTNFPIFTTVQNAKRYKGTLFVRYLSFHKSRYILERKLYHCVPFHSTLRLPWHHTILTWHSAVSSWFASRYLRRPCRRPVRPEGRGPSHVPRVPHTASRRAPGDVLRVPYRPDLTSSPITDCLFDLDSISLQPTSIHARVKHPRTVPQPSLELIVKKLT